MNQSETKTVCLASAATDSKSADVEAGVGSGHVCDGTDSPLWGDELCPLKLVVLGIETESRAIPLLLVIAGDLRCGWQEDTPLPSINGRRLGSDVEAVARTESDGRELRRQRGSKLRRCGGLWPRRGSRIA